jgi:hypothetical protein
VSKGIAEFQDAVPGDIPTARVLANTSDYYFRVEKVPNLKHCVCADTISIKEYPSEEKAHTVCNRLKDHQSRESLKGAWNKTGPVALVAMCEKEDLNHV